MTLSPSQTLSSDPPYHSRRLLCSLYHISALDHALKNFKHVPTGIPCSTYPSTDSGSNIFIKSRIRLGLSLIAKEEHCLILDLMEGVCEEVCHEMWPGGCMAIGTITVWCLRDHDGKTEACELLEIEKIRKALSFDVVVRISDRILKYGIAETPGWFPLLRGASVPHFSVYSATESAVDATPDSLIRHRIVTPPPCMYLVALDIIKRIRFHIQTSSTRLLVERTLNTKSCKSMTNRPFVVLQAGNVIDVRSHATIWKRWSRRHRCASGQ